MEKPDGSTKRYVRNLQELCTKLPFLEPRVCEGCLSSGTLQVSANLMTGAIWWGEQSQSSTCLLSESFWLTTRRSTC